jgi:hypothetical protein
MTQPLPYITYLENAYNHPISLYSNSKQPGAAGAKFNDELQRGFIAARLLQHLSRTSTHYRCALRILNTLDEVAAPAMGI